MFINNSLYISILPISITYINHLKGHKTKCNKMKDDRKRLYVLIFK